MRRISFPVAAISVVIAVQLPSSSEPIDWSFLQKIYNAAQQKAEILMTEISYILSKGDSEFSIYVILIPMFHLLETYRITTV